MRRSLLLLAAAVALVVGSLPARAAAPDVDGDVLVLVGDLVPDPDLGAGTTDHIRTANLTHSIDPDAILVAGDIQYETGALDDYRDPQGYDGSWGEVDLFARTYPVPGNHEYASGNADGYFAYWGAKARPSAASYYCGTSWTTAAWTSWSAGTTTPTSGSSPCWRTGP